jgi:formylglycine-generating enzyme required for sulfatase activity
MDCQTVLKLALINSHLCVCYEAILMATRILRGLVLPAILSLSLSLATASEYYAKKATWPETVQATWANINQAATDGKLSIKVMNPANWYTCGWIKADSFDQSFFPEKGVDLSAKHKNSKPVWQRMPGFVDGRAHSLPSQGKGPTYLFRKIHASEAMKVNVGIGSDDGVAIWLNGKLVHSNNVPRITQVNQDRLTLDFNAGENRLLMKVFNLGGGHGFAFSILDAVDPASKAAWAAIEKDFPYQTARLKKTLGAFAYHWFLAKRSNNLEQRLIGDFLRSNSEKLARFKPQFDKLVAEKVPPTDPRWLELFERADFDLACRDALYQIKLEPLGLAVDDLTKTYGSKYQGGAEYQKQIGSLCDRKAALAKAVDGGDLSAQAKVVALLCDFEKLKTEALLANPLMQFEKLLVRKARHSGLMNNWVTSCERGKHDYGNEISVLSPVTPNGKLETLVKPKTGTFLGDICLHWDADKMLVTSLGENGKNWQVFEAKTDGTGQLTQVTPNMGDDVENAEAAYLPDGSVIFSSTATMLGVPCITGTGMVANLYRLEPDQKTVRQLTFEQDQNWCPTVLNNGQVMYLRWEYTDTAHYFTRIVMHMNPDGTGQMEHYGSNSFWPNSIFFTKPVPDHPTKFVGIVTGHHGLARVGETVVFDPAKGRQEAAGVVQRIPGYGKKVEPKILDQLVANSWPLDLHPWPLSEKYYLVSRQPNPGAKRGIYLVDVFDNELLLQEDQSGAGLYEPTPLVKRPVPPVIPTRIDLDKKDATVYLTDIYKGKGLKGVPRGSVKKLRLFSYSFSYRAVGGHDAFGMESSWDSKKILGEVPVYEDGSAMFKIPANTPIALQPLDKDGRAMQLMRSWFVGMPGETVSCIGCHEPQNTTPQPRRTIAGQKRASKIEPWFGPARAFGFKYEIQPILDKYCAGCHDGKPERPDLANHAKGPRDFSIAYHNLHGYVRRPGPESDYHVFRPMEYHSSTSELMQMLERGHHNVKLDDESKRKLHAWIDLNAPFHATWSDTTTFFAPNSHYALDKDHLKHVKKAAKRYRENRLKYAFIDEDPEADYGRPEPPKPEIVKPQELPKPDMTAGELAGWPFTCEDAKKKQADAAPVAKAIDIGDGQKIELVRIPAGSFVIGDECGKRDESPRTVVEIRRPFSIMTTEVTNAIYSQFDPAHDSRYIDQQSKDHTRPGYVANGPEQPVIRVSWQEANAFCRWLSEKTGKTVRLPTEAEWEWACRAGTNTPFWFGAADADFSKDADLADESLRQFVVAGIDPKPIKHAEYQAFIPMARGKNDGRMIPGDVGHYRVNPWGLYDMHGSVSEWTASDDKPYPYLEDDGRNSGDLGVSKIVRGGSWRDRPKRARSGFRLSYPTWQKVFNVGFRVVVED